MGAKLSGGGAGGRNYTVQNNSDINVTPFVDVMLVLLIIFMVAAPLATVSIKLDFPPAVPPPPNAPKPKEPVFISIQESGALFIADKQTRIENLPYDLAQKIGGDNPTDTQVFVRADADVKYEKFMEVLNALQDNGYYKVGLIGEDIK
jgi:biopolymer transport protein ExbD